MACTTPHPIAGEARITLQAFIEMTWLLGSVVMLCVVGTAGATDYTIGTFAGHDGTTLNQPLDVAVAGTSTVYIADSQNHRVLKAETDGTISTVAGTGGRQPQPSSTGPMASRWTAPGPCTSPMKSTTGCGRSRPTGSSPRSQGKDSSATEGTAGQRPQRFSTGPPAWQWPAMALCILPIVTTTACAGSRRRYPTTPPCTRWH